MYYSKINPPKPYRMQYHMKHVESLSRLVQHEMLPHHLQPFFKLPVLLLRNCTQNLLQPRNVRDLDLNRKRVPIQHIAERKNVILRHNYRHTLGVNGLNHPWAGHLVPAGAQAKLGVEHEGVVAHVFGEVFMDLELFVPAFPVFEKDGTDRAVVPTAREETEVWAGGVEWRWGDELVGNVSG